MPQFPGMLNPLLGVSLLAAICGSAQTVARVADSTELSSDWGDLSNDWIEARLHQGQLVRLTDRVTGTTWIDIDPQQVGPHWKVFEENPFDPQTVVITQEQLSGGVEWTWRQGEETELVLRWSIEPGEGDLVLNASARTAHAVSEMRMPFSGCRITDHDLVLPGVFGVGQTFHAPWDGHLVGDPATIPIQDSNVHPLVALFEGEETGWFLEGRDVKMAPANLVAAGRGETADLALVRGFHPPTRTPEMFEIRIRAYRGHWMDAVEPYVDWLEHDLGFVPSHEQQPEWVRKVDCQAQLRVCDFEGLELLARRIDPSRTLLGRTTNYRNYPIYFNWPDYSMPDEAIQWFKRARELGFHISANVSAEAIFDQFTDLIEQLRPGLFVTGTDADGNETYMGSSGPNIYCSTAYKPWRDYLIEQLRPVVEAGADVIHLDESGIVAGHLFVNGESAAEGASHLVREIKDAYPGVAVSVEWHIKNIRHAAFAQIDYYADLGHPLTGALFSRFVKFASTGKYAQPTDEATLNIGQSWGYLLPSTGREASLNEIAAAFQQYGLLPDPRMTLAEGQLFGYRGNGGVTAYFEAHSGRRGLAIHETGKPVRRAGTRVAGITMWPGPGAVRDWHPGPAVLGDWVIYDGARMLGLNPGFSYYLDETAKPDPDRFHVTAIPEDFALHYDDKYRAIGHEAGVDGSYHRLRFTGSGRLEMFVPDDWCVFFDGREVIPDPATSKAAVDIAAPADQPGVLLAFGRSDAVLSGRWADLPWQLSPMLRQWYVGRRTTLSHRSDGFLRLPTDGGDMHTHVTGRGVIIGRLPDANAIRIHGAYKMSDRVPNAFGDGVIRINGQEVFRIPIGPPGPLPRMVHPIDVDITGFAGQHVLLEFSSEGKVAGLGEEAYWIAPQIRVEP